MTSLFYYRVPIKIHLRCYPNPESLRRTTMYASLPGIADALHLNIS